MSDSIARVVLSVWDMPQVTVFYQWHFGLRPLPSARKDWLEFEPEPGGCTFALPHAAKSEKIDPAIEIAVGVLDVRGFVAKRAKAGLKFGAIHDAGDFAFANAPDPAGNSISVPSRGLSE